MDTQDFPFQIISPIIAKAIITAITCNKGSKCTEIFDNLSKAFVIASMISIMLASYSFYIFTQTIDQYYLASQGRPPGSAGGYLHGWASLMPMLRKAPPRAPIRQIQVAHLKTPAKGGRIHIADIVRLGYILLSAGSLDAVCLHTK